MKGNISAGDKVYRISSKSLSDLAKSSYENCENIKVPLNCTVTIKKDTPIKMKICTTNENNNPIFKNINFEVTSNTIPIGALKTPISVERVVKQISKTNNTPYYFQNITVLLDDGLYVPSISSLNDLRRTALEKLEEEALKKVYRKEPVNISCANEESITYIPTLQHPNISLSFRNLFNDYDYSKLHKEKISRIYLALKLLFDKNYYDIIDYLSENYDLYVYMPSIIKSNYKNIIMNSLSTVTARFNIKGFVISNIADFNFLESYKNKYDFVGNYSLNVFNNYTIEEYKKLGLNCITLSRELNASNINEILQTSGLNTELIVYGSLPVMATNYCFLGKTNSCHPDCGTGCQKKNKYYLKDRLGFKFRLIPDNIQTVSLIFNSKILSIATSDIPVTSVRIDMIDETIDEINKVIDTVYDRGKLDGKEYTNGNLYREV